MTTSAIYNLIIFQSENADDFMPCTYCKLIRSFGTIDKQRQNCSFCRFLDLIETHRLSWIKNNHNFLLKNEHVKLFLNKKQLHRNHSENI